MINPKCDKCKKELKEFGGLIWSPPKTIKDKIMNKSYDNLCEKFHICPDCYKLLVKWIKINDKTK